MIAFAQTGTGTEPATTETAAPATTEAAAPTTATTATTATTTTTTTTVRRLPPRPRPPLRRRSSPAVTRRSPRRRPTGDDRRPVDRNHGGSRTDERADSADERCAGPALHRRAGPDGRIGRDRAEHGRSDQHRSDQHRGRSDHHHSRLLDHGPACSAQRDRAADPDDMDARSGIRRRHDLHRPLRVVSPEPVRRDHGVAAGWRGFRAARSRHRCGPLRQSGHGFEF